MINMVELGESHIDGVEQFDRSLMAREAELREECHSSENEQLSSAVEYYSAKFSPEELKSMREEMKEIQDGLKEEYKNDFAQANEGDEDAQAALPLSEKNWENSVQGDECMAMAQERLQESSSSADKESVDPRKAATVGAMLLGLVSGVSDMIEIGKIVGGEPPSIDVQSSLGANLIENEKKKKIEEGKRMGVTMDYIESNKTLGKL